MPASALTPQVVLLAGLEPTYGAANAAGNYFANSGRDFLHVKNGSTSSKSVIIDSPTACNQGSVHDDTVVVPAAAERLIGPFPKERFNDVDGNVQLTYTAVTGLTVAVLRLA